MAWFLNNYTCYRCGEDWSDAGLACVTTIARIAARVTPRPLTATI
jgi:hypothetical protein